MTWGASFSGAVRRMKLALPTSYLSRLFILRVPAHDLRMHLQRGSVVVSIHKAYVQPTALPTARPLEPAATNEQRPRRKHGTPSAQAASFPAAHIILIPLTLLAIGLGVDTEDLHTWQMQIVLQC